MRTLTFRIALVVFLSMAAASQTGAADIAKGKAAFEKCAACHSLKAGANDDAPSLAGVFGRKVAGVEEYRYSAAMRRSAVVWTEATLDMFLDDPQAFIPGNRMPFDGVKDKAERDDLIAYLKQATAPSGASRSIEVPALRIAHLHGS